MKKPYILSALLVLGLACQVSAFFGWLNAPSRSNAHDPKSMYYRPTPGPKTGRAAAAATPTVGPCAAPPWSANAVAYAVGAEVSYQNGLYQCDIANTSEAGWDPISAPALWVALGPCLGNAATASPTPAHPATATATLAPTLVPTATPVPTATAQSTWRVHAGGAAYTDTQGNLWSADRNFSGGTAAGPTTAAISGALPGAGDQALYQSQRYGASFSYSFAVPAGSYQVTLKFAETYWTAAGQRLFNVAINGSTELANFDIFASAGGANRALDKVYNNVVAAGGMITVNFGPTAVDNAEIQAIQVVPQPSATPTATQTATAALPTLTASATATSSPTSTVTAPSTATPIATATGTAVATATASATALSTATSTTVATVPPSPTPTQAPSQTSWHVRAGGTAYTDSLGQAWLADTGFSGGSTASTTHAITAPGSDPVLYQTERWGNPFTYTFTVAPGSYQVTLKMAEIYWTAAGQRVFSASINGTQVLSNLDLFAQVGGYVADDKVINNVQPNSSGQIVITLGPASVDNAKVSAIAIIAQPSATATYTAEATASASPTRTITSAPSSTPTATPSSTPTATATATPAGKSVWRVHAGAAAYTDSQGNVWSADSNFSGGTAAAPSTAAVSGALPNPADQALYQSQRYGASFSYSFPVPAGNYQVTLKFAETYWTAAGQREFNVAINGTTELTNFDIFASAGGANIALDKVYSNVAASGGAITVSFGPAAVDNAEIQAIQVLPQSQVTASPTPTRTPTVPATGKYLVGYLPDYDGSFATFAHTLNFSKMTHLDICFALPPACSGGCTGSSNMAFSLGQSDADIATLVNAAHAAGVKVMVSIGGGDNASDDQVAGFYNAGLSTQLAASLDSYVTSHNLDGVDIDIEDPANMGAPYAAFVAAVLAKEHAGGRVVSAAVANWLQTQNVMSNATLQSFDFINIMTYSTLADCQSDVAYFASLGEPHSKMVLGVPFFGWSSSGDEQPFNVIVAAYPNAGQSNSVSGGSLNNGAQYSYVGFTEMAQETQLGAQYGGVMIWELSQDAAPPNSLLNVIQANLPSGVTPSPTPAKTSTPVPTATPTTVGSCPAPTPNFGPNVMIFSPSMSSASIQSQLDSVYSQQAGNQFGSARYAFLFMPGTYNNTVNVGYYTQVMGLGASPDGVVINGGVVSNSALSGNNSTCNFWEGAENLAVVPSGGTDQWAVSQACPMRRVHIKGNAVLEQNGGWASGGWLSDSLIDGQLNAGSQQQWISRNSQWGSWAGGSWNMVFVGDNNAPSGSTWPNPPYTVINQSPVTREKPYLQVDSCGNFSVFVPSLATNTQGTTWANGATPGKAIPLSQFYIARSSVDTAATLNAALANGLNLLLTPGVYSLNGSLNVNNPNTVVLGLGLATLLAQNGVTAMNVADVDGVTVAGILFDAGATSSPILLQVGPTGSAASHAANPTLLSDLFFRVGGAAVGKANVCLQINSSNVIGDDFWIWRADHSNGVGWTVNPANNGLVVNGNNVTIYGLACEHFEQYQTLWNGNGGQVYFYQSEAPYDVPNQAAWMAGTENGYASYKVADTVTSHQAYGLGVYCNFSTNPAIILDNAMEVPTAGLNGGMLHNMVTVSLGGVGQITHILDGYGPTVNSGSTNATLIK